MFLSLLVFSALVDGRRASHRGPQNEVMSLIWNVFLKAVTSFVLKEDRYYGSAE
jgi:hypothetical protein